VGETDLAPGRRADSDSLRALVLARAPIAVEGVAGPAPTALAPIVAVYDEHRREVLLVGAAGEDLVLRYHTRAMALGLDQPTIRLPHAFRGVAVGDPFRVRIEAEAAGYCLEVVGVRRCGLGYSAGSGWGLLIFAESFPAELKRLLNAVWLCVLSIPLGLWARRRWESMLALGMAGGALILLPEHLGLLPTPFEDWAGVAAGLLSGWAARRGPARVRIRVGAEGVELPDRHPPSAGHPFPPDGEAVRVRAGPRI
jgi:hypothetical protein